jgi:4-amino-4-deoxy-L-arabinose transferase-like glycosyltransferase
MAEKISAFIKKLNDRKETLLPYLALSAIGYAFYNIALRFAPVDFDDLVLLSSVKNVSNPLSFFSGDWGFGNYGYRPLHSLSLWFSYKIFGVSSGPAQLINLLLHVAVILLLYALLLRLLSEKHWAVAFVLSCLGLISFYTVSPPTWISDRPSLFVALFLLILLNYLARLNKDQQPRFWVLGLLSLLALMSKESGLIVPLVCIYFLVSEGGLKNRRGSLVALLAILAAYSLLRFVIFGSNAATYTESGYLFGRNYYANLGELQGAARLAAYLENIVKNILAVFLPVFDGQGKLSLIGTKLNSLVVVGCTALLWALAAGKRLTRFQKIGLVIILANGLIHFQLFRYRTLYLAMLGFLIFVAASDNLKEKQTARMALVFLVAAVFFAWNMHMLGENLDFELIDRITKIRTATFEQDILATSNRIDAGIVKEIIAKYRH